MFALMTSNEVAGEYLSHDVLIESSQAPEAEAILNGLGLSGSGGDSTLHDEEAPPGSDSADAPQILEILAPATIAVDEIAQISLKSDFGGALEAALLTIPNST